MGDYLVTILATLLFCLGCGGSPETPADHDPIPHPAPVPPPDVVFPKPKAITVESQEFVPYISAFQAELLARGLPEIARLEVRWTDTLAYPAIGQCTRYSTITTSYRIVEVSRSWWMKGSETQKELLMWHELGHCVLARSHREDTDRLGRPYSLMYPYMLSASVFKAYEEEYLDELFTEALFFNPGTEHGGLCNHAPGVGHLGPSP